MKYLLAKSTKDPDRPDSRATLQSHASLVVLAAETLLERAAPAALERAGLAGERPARWFRALVLFGAFLHDWGKASDHFQQMLRGHTVGGKPRQQLVRHEALSALLALEHQGLRAWLSSAPALAAPEDAWLLMGAALAAAGHHLKFDAARSGDRRGPVRLSGAGSRITLLIGHADFRKTLRIGNTLGLGDPPQLADTVWPSADPIDDPDDRIQGPLFDRRDGLLGQEGPAAAWWAGLDEAQRRLFALAKAWIVAADVAGSALARERTSVPAWIAGALSAEPEPEQLDAVVAERLGDKPLRGFQRSIAASDARVTLVEAGCGTGKTAAAYAWAAARGRAGQGGKLFFCYPTTGTATQGFIDYVTKLDTVEARLIHGRAEADAELEGLLVTPEQEREGDEPQVRNETLQQMESGIIVCTADTVLGLLQNLRRPLFLSPAISTGRFVFDEIHAYDDRMFAALLDFLRTFPRAPVLLMSASIPRGRRAAIESITGPLADLPRPTDVEGLPRYELSGLVAPEEAWIEVRRCLHRGGKVLWVSNTVARAIDAGRRAEEAGVPVCCYHSRFRYEDRRERHKDVVDAFEPERGPVLAVTTQVAEMSLDLSADLLVTDIASAPALVQRLGRLNRRASPDDDPPRPLGRALALAPPFPEPYTSDELARGCAFWEAARALGRPLTQRDLNECMHAALGDAPWPPPGDRPAESIWLCGGPETRPGQLRDAEGTATVLLERDLPLIRAAARESASKAQRAIIRCAVPIRARRGVWDWPRDPAAPFHPIAPPTEIAYDPRWGAEWIQPNHEGALDA